VIGRIQDNSPAVRDAAIDIVGKHLVRHPGLSQQYFAVIADRIMV
jgi:hypothetical protein